MSTALTHPILRDEPGWRGCVPGNPAIVRGALEAGVQLCTCYPGTPASEIGDTFARIAAAAGIRFEYSVNEKVAIEVAFAASVAGARSLSSMKHLGLGYGGDPVSTMPYVGVAGGMLLVSAGDPSAITSPNEQDQRHLSRYLFYPILDPATPQDALRMARYGLGLSARTHLPVILRPTTRVCHTSGMVEFGPLPERSALPLAFTKDPPRHVPLPANARRMREELIRRFVQAETELSRSGFFPRDGEGPRGIIASGVGYAYASQVVTDLEIRDRVSLLQIGAYPIPRKILDDFLGSVESVLVIEELTPFVEECVELAAFRSGRQLPIHGKGSGHLPVAFEYSPDLVEDAVRAYLGMSARAKPQVSIPELPARPPVLCPGCPHRASFYLVKRVFGKKTVYSNDIGCYTLGYGQPLDTCDLLLCMGASISQASALARVTGQRTVAFLGDSTFFHSGLPPLANAVQADDEITVIILNNDVTAMTGFQPSFVSAEALSLEDAVRGLGVREVFSIDPFEEESALDALRKAKRGSGVNAVICNSPCVVDATRRRTYPRREPLAIDQEVCTQCSLCIRLLGCPAIHVEDDRYFIDPDLCVGCELCMRVCNHDAIRR